jgi:hypothetical protein
MDNYHLVLIILTALVLLDNSMDKSVKHILAVSAVF